MSAEILTPTHRVFLHLQYASRHLGHGEQPLATLLEIDFSNPDAIGFHFPTNDHKSCALYAPNVL